MARPVDAPKLRRGAECTWETCKDQPNHDDPERIVPAGFDDAEVELENIARTKIGGYATTVQSEPWWGFADHPAKPAFCMQIAGEEKAGLDAINPVQITCRGMDPAGLNRDFGSRLTFWGGGCDTRDVLIKGTPAQVRDHVRRLPQGCTSIESLSLRLQNE